MTIQSAGVWNKVYHKSGWVSNMKIKLWRKTDHTPPSVAKVKKECSCAYFSIIFHDTIWPPVTESSILYRQVVNPGVAMKRCQI